VKYTRLLFCLRYSTVAKLGPCGAYAHEPGATAVADKLVSAFSAGRLSTDDLGEDVGERAQK